MRCKTCIYFVPKQVKRVLVGGVDVAGAAEAGKPVRMSAGDQIELVDGESELGRCRRHAPTLSGWPAVFNQDWCGDHKLDETKL
ncbi:MAG TPA: hypothetical protein VEU74_12010 [Gemmatimonadales bacterium]|nr:hypothetical protein [Gemmatimonadales bacterium]